MNLILVFTHLCFHLDPDSCTKSNQPCPSRLERNNTSTSINTNLALVASVVIRDVTRQYLNTVHFVMHMFLFLRSQMRSRKWKVDHNNISKWRGISDHSTEDKVLHRFQTLLLYVSIMMSTRIVKYLSSHHCTFKTIFIIDLSNAQMEDKIFWLILFRSL